MRTVTALAALLVALGGGVGIGYLVWEGDDSPGRASSVPATGTESRAQGSPGRCDHEDTSGCAPGAELVITDDQWRCRGPLADYARELDGTLPLKVTARFTTFVNTSGPVIDLREGCTGDGTDAIDLILDVQGDGRTVGGSNDAVSAKLDANDIDITGQIDCGPRAPGAHQDGVQAQGASDIVFVDFEVGDWDEGRATCTGASAGMDFSIGGVALVTPTGHMCIRCRVVACRRGLNVGESQGVRVLDSRFRSGNPAEREERLATGEVGLCDFAVSTCNVDLEAQGAVLRGNVCDEYPYEEAPPQGAAARPRGAATATADRS